MRFVPRRMLPHEVPPWVANGAVFFVTVACAQRGGDPLMKTEVASALIESVAHRHRSGRWYARLFLAMPDHVHALLVFPPDTAMRRVVADWKRFTARQLGIQWQRDFFDHRLRAEESLELKAAYIRDNPVRRGLVARAVDWPWVFEA